MSNVTPILHRNNPDKEPLVGNTKVTKKDWLNVAIDVLISEGIQNVKVMVLAERMEVSRSSFYWYFKSRQDLLDALLQHWQDTNTAAILHQIQAPASSITHALCNFFRCFVDPELFSNPLDFAIRDWAKRAGKVRRILDQSDLACINAIEAVYEKFGYEDAYTRARILYYMQIGYNAAELNEPTETRLTNVENYIIGFTGLKPDPVEIEEFKEYARTVQKRGMT